MPYIHKEQSGTVQEAMAQIAAERIAEVFMLHLRSNRFPNILKKKGISDYEREVLILRWAFDIARDVLDIDIEGFPIDGEPKPVKLIDLML